MTSRSVTGRDEDCIQSADTLFAQHGKTIYGMIFFHVGNENLADDLYQELFLELVNHPLPKNLPTPLSYLWRMIANDVRDAMRKQANYNAKIKRYFRHCRSSSYNSQLNPLDILSRMDSHRKLADAIEDNLSAHESKVMLEKISSDKTTKEIADMLHIKERSATRYLSMGSKKLRKLLSIKKHRLDDYL